MQFADLFVGQRAEVSRTIRDADILAFAELTGDRNPVHLDEAFAASTRFEGRIAHGLLTAGLLSAVLGMHLPGPGAVYLGQTLRFRAPVRPGDTLTASAEVSALVAEKRRVRLHTIITNQHGATVVDGDADMLMLA